MLKAMRKYRQYLLVIGGTLLMVAFIMPQAIQQLHGDPGNRTVGRLGDSKITAKELGRAELAYHALREIMPQMLENTLHVRGGTHWLMLTRTAKTAGFVGGPRDGEGFLEELRTMLAQQIIRQRFGEQLATYAMNDPRISEQANKAATDFLARQMQSTVGNARMTADEYYQWLAEARGVLRMVGAYLNGARYSGPRAIDAAHNAFDQTLVDYVYINASRLVPQVAEPSEEELAASFAKFRNVNPGEGENGIGYRLPDRIKLTWMTIDRAAIEKSIPIDPVEANKRWRLENPTKTADQYGTDRQAIEAKIRAEKVGRIMSDIDKVVRAAVIAGTRRLEPDGLYRKLPADWEQQRPKYADIAQTVVVQIKEQHKVDIPLPEVHSEGARWLSRADVSAIPGIGQSVLTFGTKTAPAVDVFFLVRELRPAGSVALQDLGLQAGVPASDAALSDKAGNHYYFTVLEAAKAAAPQSLDEVRAEVTLGVKRLKAFERLQQEIPTYTALATADGLDAVAKLFGGTAGPDGALGEPPVQRNVPVTRSGSGAPDADVNVPALSAAVIKVAEPLDPRKPIAETPIENRLFSVVLPRSLGVVIGDVSGLRPVTTELFRVLGDNRLAPLQGQELAKAAGNDILRPFSFDALSQRLGLKMEAAQDEEKSAAKEPVPQPGAIPTGAPTAP